MANETKTEMTQAQFEEQLIARMNREFELKQQQREMNEVKIGARVVSKRVQVGSPILDKETREQKVVNGIPQNYPSKYFVTIQFVGSALETEINETIFDSLEEMKTYLCEGYVGEIKRFGTSYIEPIFRKFTQI